MIAFGPVPSRRLGRSLGVNNIPFKACTYSCVYCQVGRTRGLQVERRSFYDPGVILKEVGEKAGRARESGEVIDYLTFVPDGEPTLDINIKESISLLKSLGIRIAVISNASLIWREDVREALEGADWVSLKVDSVNEQTWRRVNRPHKQLDLTAILEGIRDFAGGYRGTLVTETMLVRGINHGRGDLEALAGFLGGLGPSTAYISIPIRPPAERRALPPEEEEVAAAYQIIGRQVNAEYLIGYEGNAFAFTGDPEQDLLSITAVHPMREDAVGEFLEKARAEWSVVRGLVDRGLVVEARFDGKKFYVRKFPGVAGPA